MSLHLFFKCVKLHSCIIWIECVASFNNEHKKNPSFDFFIPSIQNWPSIQVEKLPGSLLSSSWDLREIKAKPEKKSNKLRQIFRQISKLFIRIFCHLFTLARWKTLFSIESLDARWMNVWMDGTNNGLTDGWIKRGTWCVGCYIKSCQDKGTGRHVHHLKLPPGIRKESDWFHFPERIQNMMLIREGIFRL